jgi:hypothetical protein
MASSTSIGIASFALAAALLSTACTQSEGGAGGSTTTGTGGTGGTGGVVQQHVDLFSCGLTPGCDQIIYHNEPSPASALTCFAQLVVSGSPGVLDAVQAPGPYFTQKELLLVVLGDGTALVQSRFRECKTTTCPNPVPWEASSAHQICTIVMTDGLAAACAAGDPNTCAWSPWYPGGITDCHDVDDRTCAQVTALLP